MKLSDQGRALIKGFEGRRLTAYPDTKKGYSIGYGHFGAKKGDVITAAEADRLFDLDALKYETAVSLTTPRALQHEFDAMTSLAYNTGTAGFAGSTVARMHNLGDRQSAADAFRLWNKSDEGHGLQVNPVLVERREKERAIYLNGYSTPYSSPPPGPASTPPLASNQTPPGSSSGWPQTIATAPPPPDVQTRAMLPASVASIALTAIGWFLYRLLHR